MNSWCESFHNKAEVSKTKLKWTIKPHVMFYNQGWHSLTFAEMRGKIDWLMESLPFTNMVINWDLGSDSHPNFISGRLLLGANWKLPLYGIKSILLATIFPRGRKLGKDRDWCRLFSFFKIKTEVHCWRKMIVKGRPVPGLCFRKFCFDQRKDSWW